MIGAVGGLRARALTPGPTLQGPTDGSRRRRTGQARSGRAGDEAARRDSGARQGSERRRLDEATVWLRGHHQASKLWQAGKIRGGT